MRAKIPCLLMATVLAVAADQSTEAGAKKELAELQGQWKLVSLEINGEDVVRDLIKRQPRLLIKGNQVVYGGEDIAVLTADATTTPRTIDLAFLNPKRTYEGVYAVAGDTLKICINGRSERVKERPQDFSTKDKENLRLLLFRRDQAKKGGDGVSGFVGVALGLDKEQSVIVFQVFAGGPAQKAGLRKDDVVLKVGGEEITKLRSAVEAVQQTKPGREIRFHVRRDGKEKDIDVKVGVLPFRLLVQLH